eukprot:4627708-Alexandrium_andersonii.AAC.1
MRQLRGPRAREGERTASRRDARVAGLARWRRHDSPRSEHLRAMPRHSAALLMGQNDYGAHQP